MGMSAANVKRVARLERKADGAQCVDLIDCRADSNSSMLCVDKHTKMTTADPRLANAALRELDMHLTLQQQYKKAHRRSEQPRHIVKLHGYRLEGDRLHLLQEYCARGDLLAVMRHEVRMQKAGFPAAASGKLSTGSEDGVRRIFTQTLQGVAALHSAGIAHLDLSLENVFLTDDDQVRVGDLGLAERFQRNRMGQIVRHCPQSIAKVAYAAPEMHAAFAAGIPIDVSKADSWALGVILSQLWTKQPLFQTATRDDPLYRLMEKCGSLDALMTLNQFASAPSALRDLIARLLDISPHTRLSVFEALQHPWVMPSAPIMPAVIAPVLKRVTSAQPPSAVQRSSATPLKKTKARSGSCSGEIVLEKTRVSIRASPIS
ncbi:reverse transcriptase [Globisporangium polare]